MSAAQRKQSFASTSPSAALQTIAVNKREEELVELCRGRVVIRITPAPERNAYLQSGDGLQIAAVLMSLRAASANISARVLMKSA